MVLDPWLSNLAVLFLAAVIPIGIWYLRSSRAKCSLSAAQREEFFKYTSGRWLYNEDEQLAIRYVRFDVEALQEIAAMALGAAYCTSVTKTHEGSYNKIFLLTFSDNQSLIAKIPTKLIPPFYTTASEVATMDYARTVLHLPVPEVLAYSTRASSTPVGSEFILMRQSTGSELRKLWDGMSSEGVKELIDQVLHAESRFMLYSFSQIGSIYYAADVDPSLRARPLYKDGTGLEPGAEKFRIGPSTEWALWRGARAGLDVGRGPWPDVNSYIEGVVRIHQAWLANHARPYPVDVPPRTLDDMNPRVHHDLLNTLAELTSRAPVPPELCAHVLWHKDLHARNILVTDSSPPSITLLDWQSVSVGPLFHQATFALFVQYHGDSRINILDGAHLPDGFGVFPWHERVYLKHQRRLALRHLYYSSSVDPRSMEAQTWARKTHLRSAIDESSRTWDLGLGALREHLARVSGAEVQHDEDSSRGQVYKDLVARLYKELGVEGDGWVSINRFEEVSALNEERKEDWDEAAVGGPYPIADGAPSWFVYP